MPNLQCHIFASSVVSATFAIFVVKLLAEILTGDEEIVIGFVGESGIVKDIQVMELQSTINYSPIDQIPYDINIIFETNLERKI